MSNDERSKRNRTVKDHKFFDDKAQGPPTAPVAPFPDLASWPSGIGLKYYSKLLVSKVTPMTTILCVPPASH